ncbi:DUF1206 domain-containing protein [Piscibacillus sp. B03]|uniref:DUF1206 domain-containing protein n=1 Tax=Piscibacillus sp. B03 TaxID=3457430 RepID=UPI003FCC9F74
MGGNNSKLKTKQDIKPWLRRLARVGYVAKGIVFVVVGLLSLLAALGMGGNTDGTQGMLQSLASIPFGEVLLWLIGVGLIFYISWLIVKVMKDPLNKGLVSRGASFVIALAYMSLTYSALKLAMNAGNGGSSGNSEQTISAQLLQQPFGQWIIGIVGGVIIIYGLNEAYTGLTTKFMNRFHVENMSSHERKVARQSGRLGLLARGFFLALVGWFFIQTAYTSDSDQAKGLDGALKEVAQEPFGQALLGASALGLFLYGIYQFARGRYQHMGIGKY